MPENWTALAVTIYHNPDCDTSLNALALILSVGIQPTVIDYLKTPPTRERLQALVQATGNSVRELLFKRCAEYKDLGLDVLRWTDDQILDLMVQNPILISRPIVQTSIGTRLCRPSDKVLDLLIARPSGQV